MNHETEYRIGQNIRRLREGAGMTQELLAARLQLSGCDITRSAVAKIEVGQRHLYPDEIMLIKEILGVAYEDIFAYFFCFLFTNPVFYGMILSMEFCFPLYYHEQPRRNQK